MRDKADLTNDRLSRMVEALSASRCRIELWPPPPFPVRLAKEADLG
jgi:hypothetical protein